LSNAENLPDRWDASSPEDARPAATAAPAGEHRMRDASTVHSAMEKLSGVPGLQQLSGAGLRLRAARSAPRLPIGHAVVPPQVARADAYRALAANLWARYGGPAAVKTLLFVGASGRSDVSTVAGRFAAVLAHDRLGPVLFVSARARVPAGTAHDASAPPITLPRLLADGAVLEPPSAEGANLHLLCTGHPGQVPPALSHSDAFERFLASVRDAFSAVIVDGPHVALHPETLLLCSRVDGVVLVVESERTRKRSAVWVARQVEDAGGRLLGVVLNRRRFRIPEWIYARL